MCIGDSFFICAGLCDSWFQSYTARMPRRKSLPPLTPRAREAVNAVVNSVALGTHDDDAEVGALAKAIGMTASRLEVLLRKLEAQGWIEVKNGFVYPTTEALKWQNPQLDDKAAAKLLKALK
jgi:hypothetical protein